MSRLSMAKAPKKVWEGRFQKPPDRGFEAFSRSLHFDLRLAPYELVVDRVWSSALAKVGVFSAEEVQRVHAALQTLADRFARGAVTPQDSDEDVHSLIERLLSEELGPVGEKIHTGRSRNDLVVTDLKLYLRDHLTNLLDNVSALQQSVLRRAWDSQRLLLPAYTHLQRAQPVSLAHYLLALFWALQRTVERIHAWFALHNTCPLGSGACAGSGFPVDREALAAELGFDRPTPNSVDAVASRDFVTDAAHACAVLMLDLSRYAEDWILWSSSEFGFLTLDESLTTGSSLMPQKRNPDSLELIRGKTARVVAAETRLQMLAKGLPLTYNRDLQEDKEPIFDALEQTQASLGIFAKVVDTVRWNPQQMSGALDPSLMATDLAEYLVSKGLPFREAHRLVGRMVLHAERVGRSLNHWAVEDFRRFSELVEEDVFAWLRPESSVARRNLVGGTGPEAVARQLEEAQKTLEQNHARLRHYQSLRVL